MKVREAEAILRRAVHADAETLQRIADLLRAQIAAENSPLSAWFIRLRLNALLPEDAR